MKQITSRVRQYPTAAFFALAILLSVGVGAITDTIYDATNSIPLALPFALLSTGPLVAALIVSALIGGKAEVLALLRKFTMWRVGWRWYAVALFLLPALHLVAVYGNVYMGAPVPTTVGAFGSWSSILSAFALRLVNPFDGPMLEELGWRGFAQPRLQRRYSPLIANLLLALVVTLWHLQYMPSGQYTWLYMPGTIASTLFYGWVYNATGGSVLLPLIMHATEPLLWINFTGADAARAMGLLVLVYVITAMIVVLVTGKNLGRKTTSITQRELDYVAKPAAAR